MDWKRLIYCTTGALLLAGQAHAALMGEYLLEGNGNDTSGLNRHGTATGTTGTPDFVPGLYLGSTQAARFNFDAADVTGPPYNPAFLQRFALPANTGFIQNAPGATLMAWVRNY
jgi:hypothetical protein